LSLDSQPVRESQREAQQASSTLRLRDQRDSVCCFGGTTCRVHVSDDSLKADGGNGGRGASQGAGDRRIKNREKKNSTKPVALLGFWGGRSLRHDPDLSQGELGKKKENWSFTPQERTVLKDGSKGTNQTIIFSHHSRNTIKFPVHRHRGRKGELKAQTGEKTSHGLQAAGPPMIKGDCLD